VGIHPGWGITQLLQQAIGRRRARQMSFTCQFINAQTAYEWGLVNEVTAPDRLLTRTLEIADQIAADNADLLPVIQKLIDYRDTVSLSDAFAHERSEFRKFVGKHLTK
jgi:enoyl-CoA hydratase